MVRDASEPALSALSVEKRDMTMMRVFIAVKIERESLNE
jgi:hypothetical protein